MKKIGLLGSGQLGRMTIEESRKLLSCIEVLSPEYPSPAALIADETLIGALDDFDAIQEMADRVDVLSYEIEHVNVDALLFAQSRGKVVIPPAEVLALIQDKAAQKSLMDLAGIPSAPWLFAGDGSQAATTESLLEAARKLGGFPVVQKARKGGYDGRGVSVIRNEEDARGISEGGRLLPVPSFVERCIDFSKELAVVLALDTFGNSAAYPCAEMMFDSRANLCDSVLMPAREPLPILEEAERLAKATVNALAQAAGEKASKSGNKFVMGGIFAVELFLTRDGRVLVNETAPRPHNSGHLTMEASVTSQFSQYYRILAGYPLGSTEQVRPAMMVNLLGEEGAHGEPVYGGLERALAVPGVTVHLYGKGEVMPFRKMGHLTALGATSEEAVARAESARSFIKIHGASKAQ